MKYPLSLMQDGAASAAPTGAQDPAPAAGASPDASTPKEPEGTASPSPEGIGSRLEDALQRGKAELGPKGEPDPTHFLKVQLRDATRRLADLESQLKVTQAVLQERAGANGKGTEPESFSPPTTDEILNPELHANYLARRDAWLLDQFQARADTGLADLRKEINPDLLQGRVARASVAVQAESPLAQELLSDPETLTWLSEQGQDPEVQRLHRENPDLVSLQAALFRAASRSYARDREVRRTAAPPSRKENAGLTSPAPNRSGPAPARTEDRERERVSKLTPDQAWTEGREKMLAVARALGVR